jgi:hypothetical protein
LPFGGVGSRERLLALVLQGQDALERRMFDYRHIVFPEPCEHPFLQRPKPRKRAAAPNPEGIWKSLPRDRSWKRLNLRPKTEPTPSNCTDSVHFV